MKAKIFNLFAVIAALSLLTSCSIPTGKMNEITIDNQFKIDLPDYMKKLNLNEDASLQYGSEIRDVYCIVIEDSFEEIHDMFIDEEFGEEDYDSEFEYFCDLVCSNYEAAFFMENDLEKMDEIVLNETMNAKVLTNTRKIKGLNIFYKAALVEGNNTYYKIITWTQSPKEKKINKVMDEIINSFSEL